MKELNSIREQYLERRRKKYSSLGSDRGYFALCVQQFQQADRHAIAVIVFNVHPDGEIG